MGQGKELQKNKQVNEIKVEAPTYEEVQNPAWMMIEQSKETSTGAGKKTGKYADLNKMDLKALRDALSEDKGSKSEIFTDMFNSVNDLLNLAATGGKYEVDNKELVADFFETFYTARMQVNHYLYTRDGFHWTGKGERRIQIVRRISDILGRLNTGIEQYKASLPAEKARMLEYKQQNLSSEEIEKREDEFHVKKAIEDMMSIATTGRYGENKSQKERDELSQRWIVKDYSAKIRQIISGTSLDKIKDKDDFIAFLEDRNNRLIANRLAVKMMAEKADGVTFGMPWMTNRLVNYVTNGIGEDALFELKPEEVAVKAQTIIDEYKTENKDVIEKTGKRVKAFSKALHIPTDIYGLYEYPAMKQLLDESDDEDFETRIESMKDQQKKTDAQIRQMIEERFSVATRDSVTAKLIRNLGALRLFGDYSQIMDQCDRFFEMIRYIAPLEYKIENTILHTMQDLKIDLSRRDHFVTVVSGGDPKQYLTKYLAGNEAIKKYAKRTEANTKSFLKRADDEATLLTVEQWNTIEKLNSKSGEYDNSVFKDLITQTISANVTGEKLSRKEYLSKRKFQDAQKTPERQRRIKVERKRIAGLNGTLDTRFIIHLAGYKGEDYLPYRKLEAAYKGLGKQYKVTEEKREERLKDRKSDLKNVLRAHKIPVPEMDSYIERFKPFMMGLFEIEEDMYDDEKIRNERRNLENFGVRDWDDALLKFESYIDSFSKGEVPGQIKEAEEKYSARLEKIRTMKLGKYSQIADILSRVPDIRIMIMNDEDKFNKFLTDVLEPRFGALAEVLDKEKHTIPEAVRKTYVYSYINEIYTGTIGGDEAFFEDQLKTYSTKVFKVRPEGQSSAADSIKSAENYVRDELKKAGIKGAQADAIRLSVVASIYELANDPADFEKLFDSNAIKKLAKDRLKEIREGIKEDEHKDDESIKKALKSKENFLENLPDAEDEDKIKNIEKEKEKGRKSRSGYLGMDLLKISRMRTGKSLIRVKEKGAQSVSLDAAKADKMRGLIKEYCGDLNLPPVLIDALVEGGASQSIKERATGTRMWSGLLYKHAFAMSKMYDFLRQAKKDDPAMSEEEAQMFIVKNYGDISGRKLFEKAGGPDVAELRKSSEYQKFREDYKKLKAFEAINITDPSLERERLDIATDMRTVLMTGVGLKSGDIADLADRATKYLDYSSKVTDIIRKRVERYYKGKEMPELFIDRQVGALREYFLNEVIKKVEAGEKFDEADWGKTVSKFYADKINRANVEFGGKAITDKEYQKAVQNRTSYKVSEEDIAKTIREGELLFNGRLNKYDKLDVDQKKLFAIALVMMDKGSIGMGTKGTVSLLAPQGPATKENTELSNQIAAYIKGGELNVNVNYREALYKLINYGKNNILDPEHYTFSVSAYDKALQFARAVSAKRLKAGERDMKRLANGYTSINAAYVNYGKTQQQHVDALPLSSLTIDDVRKKLLGYANKDKKDTKTLVKNMAYSAVGNFKAARRLDKDLVHNRRMNKIIKRLGKMSESDLKVFIRLMQERTVLDKSMVDDGSGTEKAIDEEKKKALIEALSSDSKTRADVLDGFDDPEACRQALTTALSFKLRDDLVLKGKTLTKGCFDSSSLNRKTLVDWEVVERALDMMDSIAEKKMAIHAMSHATDFIAFAGNKAASDEYVKLLDKYKKKDKFKQENFEKLIKEQADKDKNEDVLRAVSGYHSLSEKEKKLFFRVLARRDFLDISRINYNSSFLGRAERDFVNKVGRNALIDEYIDSSLEGNIGIQLDEKAYFDAMASLFSTQISDRTKFKKEKDLTKIFAYERQLFRGRGTAIDWKLFKRALQFVNRATEELELAEGNAQLYRGAGQLSKNGHINMNYSFLRKNIHRTGNHWARYTTRAGIRLTKEIVGNTKVFGDTTLDSLMNTVGDIINVADDITKVAMGKDGMVQKGTAWLKRKKDQVKSVSKELSTDLSAHKINTIEIKKKEKTQEEKDEEEQKEAERRAQLDYCDHLKEGIDNIIAQSKSVGEAFNEVAGYLKTNLIANSEKLKWFRSVNGVAAQQDKNNIVNDLTQNTSVDKSYGDWRDTGKKAIKTGEKVKDISGTVIDIAKKAPVVGDFVSDLDNLIKTSTQKIAYRFLNDAIIHNDIDLTPRMDENGNLIEPDELAEYRKNAEMYAKDAFTSILKGAIGEENANKLLDVENYVYDVKQLVSETMVSVFKGINYVKKCTAHVKNIVSCAENISAIKGTASNAKKLRSGDEDKLEEASNRRLSPEQTKLVKKIVAKHRGLQEVAEDIVTAVQAFNISEEALNMVVDTVSIAGGKLNIGQEAIAKAIKAGMEFAMYATKVATDRVALTNYFKETDAGKEVVEKIKKGFDKTGNKSLQNANFANLIDVISDARGYEHTSELIENTGMSMAQSIVFSASAYNPLEETKLMAITVMSVMGLESEIGKTNPETVEKLFLKFRMSR